MPLLSDLAVVFWNAVAQCSSGGLLECLAQCTSGGLLECRCSVF